MSFLQLEIKMGSPKVGTFQRFEYYCEFFPTYRDELHARTSARSRIADDCLNF
jgi:hypothetical protein